MPTLNTLYHPLTSRPFLWDNAYAQYQPCEALRPYIACYWTQGGAASRPLMHGKNSKTLVIPDTCMDIIIRVNHTRQEISGCLCFIQDQPFYSLAPSSGEHITTFGIRFHFWTAHLFLRLNLKDSRNQIWGLDSLGREWELLFEPFLYLTTVKQQISRAESFLLKKAECIAYSSDLLLCSHHILSTCGKATVSDISAHSCVSQRQLERLFLQTVGLPLKRISNLVRYQNVWRDMVCSPGFDIHDAVLRYGYTDQSHLLREFKRFHGMSPANALKLASP